MSCSYTCDSFWLILVSHCLGNHNHPCEPICTPPQQFLPPTWCTHNWPLPNMMFWGNSPPRYRGQKHVPLAHLGSNHLVSYAFSCPVPRHARPYPVTPIRPPAPLITATHVLFMFIYWEFNSIGGLLSRQMFKIHSRNPQILGLWLSIDTYIKIHQFVIIFLVHWNSLGITSWSINL